MVLSEDEIYWQTAGQDLGITTRLNVLVMGFERLGPVDVLIECFGGKNGTIVVHDYNTIAGSTSKLVEAGYGYSVLEPGNEYNREIIIEMLRDWGWSCSSPPPHWY
jgi:hypothetical protein